MGGYDATYNSSVQRANEGNALVVSSGGHVQRVVETGSSGTYLQNSGVSILTNSGSTLGTIFILTDPDSWTVGDRKTIITKANSSADAVFVKTESAKFINGISSGASVIAFTSKSNNYTELIAESTTAWLVVNSASTELNFATST